jgi:hypothetical protein
VWDSSLNVDELFSGIIGNAENAESSKGKIISNESTDSKSFIRILDDRIEIVVDGTSGIVITSDGVYMQGTVQQNTFPTEKKTMGFYSECPTHLLFIPGSMVTPQPNLFPANPLSFLVRLAKKLR